MIYEFTIETAFRLGNVIDGMHRLRKKTFVDLQGWTGVPLTRNQSNEYDQFDTLDARYLVGIDEAGVVRAVCRNLFCDRPWMLQTLWAERLAPSADLPNTADWAEGTRMAVDPSLSQREAMKWQAEMSCAGSEWALHYGVKKYSFVTYLKLAKHLEKTFDITYWGESAQWPDGEFIAGYWQIDQVLLDKQRRLTGIADNVLVPLDEVVRVPASQLKVAA